jgi:tetratricopeptide (TPR) repeat protein
MINRKQYTAILLTAVFLSWIFCGCQTTRSHRSPDQDLLNRVLNGESLLGEQAALLPLPEEDIFGITSAMRDFLKTHVPGTLSNYYKLQTLIEAVTDKSQLGWDYDAFKTYTAADTFKNRKGNCISYAIMMVVLGRELGLEMHFNEVLIPPTWDIQTENTVVLFRHVNVLAKVDGKRMVLGLNMEEYDSSFPQRIISDIEAEAHFYNNRGTDYLNANDMKKAFLYFRKALMLQPGQAFLWGNMGVLYLRYGYYKEAEAAFLHALELDSSESTSISNLQRLYVKQGNTQLADYYREEAELSRMKNPYYRYYLARKLLDENKPEPALKQIKWSIREYGKEHRFYYLEAKIYARLGRQDDAEKSLERAAELTENADSRLLYESKISRLREVSGK